MIKHSYSPLILFVYNRLWHTEQTVEALKNNDLSGESNLFIFSDGPKVAGDENVKLVREYIKTISGFKSISIIERENNLGLADSVISGVSEIINKYGKVIVLEDDITTARFFLKFMNDSLEFFKDRSDVFSVSGHNHSSSIMKIPKSYKHDIYLSYRFGSWGWATWKDRWNKVDWEVKGYEKFNNNKELHKRFERGGIDAPELLKSQMEGKIDSWAIRFNYSHFIHDCYNVRPAKTLVKNIGFDGSGVHCEKNEKYQDVLDDSFNPMLYDIGLHKKILNNFAKVADRSPKYSIKRFFKKIIKKVFK